MLLWRPGSKLMLGLQTGSEVGVKNPVSEGEGLLFCFSAWHKKKQHVCWWPSSANIYLILVKLKLVQYSVQVHCKFLHALVYNQPIIKIQQLCAKLVI